MTIVYFKYRIHLYPNEEECDVRLDSIPIQLIVQVVLILFNAFFAASEMAVVSLNPALLLRKIDDGDKKAERLYEMNKEPTGFLSTIQVGITLAGFLGSAFAADGFSGYLVDWIYYDLGITALSLSFLDTLAVIVITIILSFFTLIFGELVPKQIAMHYPYEVASFTAGLINILEKVMRPLVWLLSKTTNAVLHIFNIDSEKEEDDVSEEEIRSMAALGSQKGIIDHDENEWIQNVFKFDDITIKEIMTHRTDVIAIKETDDYDKIKAVIREHGVSRLPVNNRAEDDVVGVVYARDIFLADKESFDLKKIMRKPYFVPETLKADCLFDEMRKKKNHFAIVVDEYGGIDGIVTMEDLVEAIVGDIYDEYDTSEETDYTKIDDNTYKVNGSMSLDDVYELTKIRNFKEESEEYDTISGYVLARLDKIPEDDAKIEIEEDGVKLNVVKIKRHKLEEIIIQKTK